MSTELLETETVPAYPAQTASASGRTSLNILSRWWGAFGASALFVVSGHLLIKAGLNASSGRATPEAPLLHLAHLLMRPQVACGLVIYLFGSVFWMMAVSKRDIGFLYPLSSINYVLVVLASIILFGERVSLNRSVGVMLIVVGMGVMNRRRRGAPL